MDAFSFKTIASEATGQYKEKGSRFLAFAYPVQGEEEVKTRLQALKKQYFDARHHCFAWVLGPGRPKVRAFDDGEPNHSAGDPILGQIRSKGLTNILIVVVRYFGGTKLGVSGLINAYRSAAADALANAAITSRDLEKTIGIRYRYDDTPAIMQLVKECKLRIDAQDYGDYCQLTVGCKLKEEETFLRKVALLKATGHAIELS